MSARSAFTQIHYQTYFSPSILLLKFLFDTILDDFIPVRKLEATLIVKIVKLFLERTTTKRTLFFPGKITMTRQSGCPADQVTFIYYQFVMHLYQLVSQISSNKYP